MPGPPAQGDFKHLTRKGRKVMKESKKDFFKLEDEVLEGVSGGCSKEAGTFPCIYCKHAHPLIKYYPVSAVIDGMIYRNAEGYVCKNLGRINKFYVITEGPGKHRYFDSTLNEVTLDFSF